MSVKNIHSFIHPPFILRSHGSREKWTPDIMWSSDYFLRIYCYFRNVSADMSSGLLQVFVELRNLHGTSNYVLYHIIFTNPSARAGYDTRSIFKRSLTGLTSEFSFSLASCLTKAEEPSLPYYLPIAGGRIIGYIPFPRVLVLCEMQLVSSRI